MRHLTASGHIVGGFTSVGATEDPEELGLGRLGDSGVVGGQHFFFFRTPFFLLFLPLLFLY